MPELVIASSEADAHAAEAVQQHHAVMAGALRVHTEALLAAVSRGDRAAAEQVRGEMSQWCADELVPHARAEEDTLYPVAGGTTEGRLLVEGMLGEHAAIVGLVDELAGATDVVRAAAAARALLAVFETHLAKENEQILPLLLGLHGTSVAELLEGMHALLGERPADPQPAAGCGGHACSCGATDPAGHPELDARSIPHAIRHATIFGALEAVHSGAGLVLVAPHDPLPLLDQVEDRWPGIFAVEYLERGPEVWRLAFTRAG
jgi:uncharacterized protein (DUF2249 family)